MSYNTTIFHTIYIGAGLALVFIALLTIFSAQKPFCAVGVDTINECWHEAFERLKEQADRALRLEGFR